MYVFAQDIKIRNWWRFSLYLQPYGLQPPFSTAKKTWRKVLKILLLKCNPKSNAYPWKQKMPKSNHYILKYGDWKFGQGNNSIRTLHQPPIRISSPQGKT
jgi:hypothetical protein